MTETNKNGKVIAIITMCFKLRNQHGRPLWQYMGI